MVNFYKLLLIITVIGCSKKTNDARKIDAPLIIGVENSPKNLDPVTALDAASWRMTYLYTQALVDVGSDLLPYPELAKSYQVKSNGKVYIIRLRENAVFHNGKKITAEDVKYSFSLYASEKSPFKNAFNKIKLEVINDLTIQLTLPEIKSDFLTGDLPVVRILPKDVAQDFSGATEGGIIGSGPLVFQKISGRDVYFTDFKNFENNSSLQKNSNYSSVVVRTINDPSTRYFSLLKGEVDVLFNSLPLDKVFEIQKTKKANVYNQPGIGYQYLAFSFKQDKLKQQVLRNALSLAINRDEIIKYKLKGLATKSFSLLSSVHYYYNRELSNLSDYNPEKAKKLVASLNLPADFAVEIKTSSDPTSNAILRIIKDQWSKVGIKANIKSAEFATFFADIKKGAFEVASLRWPSVPGPELFYDIFHSSNVPPGKNRGFYKNEKIDVLLSSARKLTDKVARKKIYDQVQEIIVEEKPYISLWHPNNIVVTSKEIKNLKINALGRWNPVIFTENTRNLPSN